jgi:GTP-binding protein
VLPLFKGDCDFVLSVAHLSQLPDSNIPEVAFAGRSNVGKSSLINALTRRKTLARTSNTPGRTQQLNYFNLSDHLFLVDMPGYGYAKVSKTQKKSWNKLIQDYLKGRPQLRCVFILIDSRHGLKKNDIELMTILDQSAVSYRIVLTKIDKVKDEQLSNIIGKIESALKKHAAAFPSVMVTSAVKNLSIHELQDVIASYSL